MTAMARQPAATGGIRYPDLLRLSLGSVRSQPLRSLLTALGICIGIASVVLLTSIGEGLRRFVLEEFTQFGTHLVAVNPGRSVTAGLSGALIHNLRPLTLDDAEALQRLPGVRAVVPVAQGNAEVKAGGRSRHGMIVGVGRRVPEVWSMQVASGRFLPDEDLHGSRSLAVLGSRMRQELFGNANPLGRRIRIAGAPFRVVGVMAPKGQLLGFDLDDTVYIPAARAMSLFNLDSLMEIDVLYAPELDSETIARRIRRLLQQRHGDEDFSITTQDQMLATLDDILAILSAAIGALGGISLLVGAVGILTIMTIGVSERTAEIGLLRALGARTGQILHLFLAEAIVLSALGGLAGLVLGIGGSWLLHGLVPGLPTHVDWRFVLLAEGLSLLIGLLAGIEPARRAARLDPIEALRAE